MNSTKDRKIPIRFIRGVSEEGARCRTTFLLCAQW